ncbi:hypothetical protein ESCOMM127M_23600 [Escherichia coli]|nr:hypothetical protein HmCms191_00442 [Escherichia coli]GCX92394.1 hypothetical protein HmCmsJML113_04216 [Escherichia coli]GDF31931.1 hypothetical protein HmCmsJML287_02476 [Escherichia coli]GDH00218.1 hypothetical protein BvCmsKKP036_03101 [Escherichia coli]
MIINMDIFSINRATTVGAISPLNNTVIIQSDLISRNSISPLFYSISSRYHVVVSNEKITTINTITTVYAITAQYSSGIMHCNIATGYTGTTCPTYIITSVYTSVIINYNIIPA